MTEGEPLLRAGFALTFDEYREAARLTHERMRSDLKNRKRSGGWIAGGAMVLMVAISFPLLDYLLASPPLPAGVSVPWQDSARPASKIVTLFVIIYFSLLIHLRRQQRDVYLLAWEGQPQLHQLRSIEFHSIGFVSVDAFSRVEFRWAAFRKFAETPTLFILYYSPYTFEILPKRAFAGQAEAEVRALLSVNIQPQMRAFPVAPTVAVAS